MRFFTLLLFLLISTNAYSTHIIGGEMHYRYLGTNAAGNDTFQLTLKVYRDCNPGNAAYDNTITIGIYQYQNGVPQLYNTLNVPFPGSVVLPNDPGNPCLNIPPNICVEEAIYETIVVLPPSAEGYALCWQRCCRNNTIVNLVTPGDVGGSFLSTIPGMPYHQNSDPIYNEFPPTVICSGYALEFDHSAYDYDGDELVYELCAPYDGGTPNTPIPNPPFPPPYALVPYAGTFTAAYPLPANPQLSIDAQSGLLTGYPTAIGQYVVGICVKEYRNGVLLSEHKRDFQFNVTNCSQVTAVIVPPPTPDQYYQFVRCANYSVDFPNNSTPGVTYSWDFGVTGIDTDTSTASSPTYVFPDTGFYLVQLIANPGVPCSDTAYVEVLIIENFEVTASPVDTILCPGQSVQINSTGGATFQWTPTTGLSNPNIANPVASPMTSTAYSVYSTLDLCANSATVFVQVLPVPSLALVDEVWICPGDSTQLFPQGQGQFSWTPNTHIDNPNTQYPWVSPDEPTMYYVAVYDSASCIQNLYDSVKVSVYQNTLDVVPNDITIILGTSTFLSTFGGVSYQWSPTAGLATPDAPITEAQPTETTTYTVLVTFDNGCTLEGQVVVRVNPEPEVLFPNAFTPNGDGLNDRFRPYVRGLLTVDGFQIYNRWGKLVYDSTSPEGWDGTADGVDQELGVYAFVFKGRGSVTGTPFVKQGNVTLVR